MPATLQQLRHLIALDETGSFTAGARAVHRSQAAFSRSVAMLEAEMGAALVDRIGHRNQLSSLGRVVLEHARHVVAEADRLEDAARTAKSRGPGQLRLGLAPTPAALLTLPLLQLAAQDARPYRLQIAPGATGMLVQGLLEHKLDALVVAADSLPPQREIEVEPIARLQAGLLCRPGHPLRRRRSVGPVQLLRYPVACTTLNDALTRAIVARHGPEAHPELLVNLWCEDVLSLLALARSSDTVFMGTLAAGREFVARGELVRLPADIDSAPTEFVLVRLRARSESAWLERLRTTARAFLRD